MFCTNCGNKVEDSAIFCTKCGTPTEQNQANVSTPVTIEPVISSPSIAEPVISSPGIVEPVINSPGNAEPQPPKKKGKGKLFIVIGACVLLLAAGSVGGYFLYQKHIVKQAAQVISYQEDGDYDLSLRLYKKYEGKNKEFDNEVVEGLKEAVNLVDSSFYSGRTDYGSAIEQLDLLKEYNLDELDNEITKAYARIERINTSRINYQEAKSYYDQGDYTNALLKYDLILKEDKKYYDMANNDVEQIVIELERIRNEESKIQEQNRLNEIRLAALVEASEYANQLNYEMAIAVIEEAIIQVPDDLELTDMLSFYVGLNDEFNSMLIRVPEVVSSEYSHTYMDQDKQLMDVLVITPVIQGNLPAYTLINQTIEDSKAEFIAYCDTLAEDAKLYIGEESFTAYAFEMAYNVRYNNNGILCISLDSYVYTGGAHGNPITDVLTFDLTTGNTLNLSDLISADNETFSSYVADEFQKMYDESPDEYWVEAPDQVRNESPSLDEKNYYLTDEGIVVFYYPYELASYARYFVEILIPYSGNEWMFKFL